MLYIRNPQANGLRGRVLHTRVKKNYDIPYTE